MINSLLLSILTTLFYTNDIFCTVGSRNHIGTHKQKLNYELSKAYELLVNLKKQKELMVVEMTEMRREKEKVERMRKIQHFFDGHGYGTSILMDFFVNRI